MAAARIRGSALLRRGGRRAVVAENRYAAADAATLARIDHEVLPAFVDFERGTGSSVLFRRAYAKGDVDAAFAEAAVVVRETFRHDRVAPSWPR